MGKSVTSTWCTACVNTQRCFFCFFLMESFRTCVVCVMLTISDLSPLLLQNTTKHETVKLSIKEKGVGGGVGGVGGGVGVGGVGDCDCGSSEIFLTNHPLKLKKYFPQLTGNNSHQKYFLTKVFLHKGQKMPFYLVFVWIFLFLGFLGVYGDNLGLVVKPLNFP